MKKSYMSQFPNNAFGNALRKHVESNHLFYREYVWSDHNHETIAEISKEEALKLINNSAARVCLSSYMIGVNDVNAPVKYIMNKGAIRVDDFDESDELWVYNHDGIYYTTRPRK